MPIGKLMYLIAIILWFLSAIAFSAAAIFMYMASNKSSISVYTSTTYFTLSIVYLLLAIICITVSVFMYIEQSKVQ